MSDAIRLCTTTVHCPDPVALARFYTSFLDSEIVFANEVWAVVDGPGGRLDFQAVRDFAPPTWPDGPQPVRMHLDFLVDDLVATEAKVLAAGATKLADQPNADHCFVFADPAGHPFCLSTWDNSVR